MSRITKVERNIEKVSNQRSPVKWRVRYRDPAGKRQVKTLDSPGRVQPVRQPSTEPWHRITGTRL
jgi:hypothetical protein